MVADAINGGTVLRALGPMKDELIRVLGYNNAKTEDTIHIAGQYVPVNATVIPLKQTATLKVGDKIRIVRPSTAGWLSVLGTDRLGNEQEYNSRNGLPVVMIWCGSVLWLLLPLKVLP